MPDTDYPDKPAIVAEAIARFKVGLDATQKQRDREKEDLSFQDPLHQWPSEARVQREAQLVNGIHLPARPMLSIPTLDQPVQLVFNQQRAAQLGVTIDPLSEDADDDTAEILEGLYRTIERDSRASLARTWAFERAVLCGRGCYRINTVYDASSPHALDQKIVIERILYQDAVVFDPFAEQPDWSDGAWAFETLWLPWRVYRSRYPTSKLTGYSEQEWLEEAATAPEWIRGDKESRAVLVAVYWKREITPKMRVLCADGSTPLADQVPDGVEVLGDLREEECATVTRTLVNAVEELEPAQTLNGHYIPIVPVVGRELLPFDGERRWVGMIGPNKDAARLFNYAASNAVEIAALEPKAPFDVDPAEVEGLEPFWELANVRNFPYLPRHKFAPNGQPFGPIGRIQADMSRLGPSLQLMEQAQNFLHMGTGAYEPALGETSERARSGRAILSLQQQHEAGNSHWLDNLAEITLSYEAKVILDLMPAVYDRPGRVERVLNLEGEQKKVVLNAPFVPPANGGRPQALPLMPPGQGPPPLPAGVTPGQVKHYDLKRGKYQVVVSVGKGYKSQLEEGTDRLGQLFAAQPELFKILGDIWLEFQSWPGHRLAAERMKKMLPPQLLEVDGEAPDPEVQLQQLQQQNQQLQQQLAQAAEIIKTERTKVEGHLAAKQLELQGKAQIEQMTADAEADRAMALAIMNNAAKIAIAHITAASHGADIEQHASEEAAALGRDHAFQATQADADRQHEALLAQQQQAHDRALTAQQAGHDQDLAAQQAMMQPSETDANAAPTA